MKEEADRGSALSQFQVAMHLLGRPEKSEYNRYIRLSVEQGFLLAESYLGNGLIREITHESVGHDEKEVFNR